MKLVLFDIDGTLLWTDGAGRRAIGRAIGAELGRELPLDDYRFDGKTDLQIVGELFALAGDPDPQEPQRLHAVCQRYVAHLDEELDRAPGRTVLLPGVSRLLDALEREAGVVIGLLTGNVQDGARLKLRAAGVSAERFRVGAFGSDSAIRGELPAVAFARARALFGASPDPARAVVVGDTPADVACGLGAGARTVAVATGSYGEAELYAAGAHHVFDDLTDLARVLPALVG
jgi:phosphoglycolate phosphatase-like HAD superfamily hydrolase